ncbi:MAG TPA: hypothetical protein VJ438_06025 [Candidatus Nanoarchaeia archaeon]|nr:hypothetical protein [Candidatus Nanoarchaeia archaeon]
MDSDIDLPSHPENRVKFLFFSIRLIGSLFFAFFIMIVGVYIAPSLVQYDKNGFMFLYTISILISAIWILLNGCGVFDD